MYYVLFKKTFLIAMVLLLASFSFSCFSSPLHKAIAKNNNNLAIKLIKAGASLKEFNSDGLASVHIAAKNGNIQMLALLRKHKANLSQLTNLNNTALIIAVKANKFIAVKWLLLNTNNINHVNSNTQFSAVHYAIQMNSIKLLNILIRGGAKYTSSKSKKIEYSYLPPLNLAAKLGRNEIIKYLLKRKVNINHNKGGRTALIVATRYKRFETVKLLLANNANLEDRGYDKETALHTAVKYADTKFVRLLLSKGANIESREFQKYTPLLKALELRRFRMAKYLILRGAKLDVKEQANLGPLHIVVQNINYVWAEYLIRQGVDVNARGSYRATPLHIAASNGSIRIARLLLSKGAKISTLSELSFTPLLRAVANGHLKMAQFLITKGAKLKHIDKAGNNALHIAARHGRYKLIPYLLGYGFTVDTFNNFGQTPLHIASEGRSVAFLKGLLLTKPDVKLSTKSGYKPVHLASRLIKRNVNIEILKLLILQGVNVNAIDPEGNTPILLASSQNYSGYVKVKLLSAHGAKPDVVNKTGESVLHRAARGYYLTLHEFLKNKLLRSKYINAQDAAGRTPLHYAVLWRDPRAVDVLLRHTLKVNIVDKKGLTPLQYAVRRKEKKMESSLRRYTRINTAPTANRRSASH